MFLLHSVMPTVTSKSKLNNFNGSKSFIVSKIQEENTTVIQIFAMLISPASRELKNKLNGDNTGGFSKEIFCKFLVKIQNKRLIKRWEKSKIKPIILLLKIFIPTTAKTKEGPAFTE